MAGDKDLLVHMQEKKKKKGSVKQVHVLYM